MARRLGRERRSGSIASTRRASAQRDPYEKVLIVCEGGKTEPNYFEEIRSYYRLSTANIEITGKCGSAPKSVVSHAKELYMVERRIGDPYDKVYCVFDKDSHDSYEGALDAVRSAKPKGVFIAIPSVPCFEYWILLHFVYTTRAYVAQAGNSAGAQVLAALVKHMPHYTKGCAGVFNELVSTVERAKTHADRALQAANGSGTDNPTTRVHELVTFLQRIKS